MHKYIYNLGIELLYEAKMIADSPLKVMKMT